ELKRITKCTIAKFTLDILEIAHEGTSSTFEINFDEAKHNKEKCDRNIAFQVGEE
ncbi:hypothetical protein J1N35_007497, partial [Gossypium stocksii]